MAGLLSLLKDEKGKPIVPGFQIADVGGGALHAVIGILAALTARSADGLGRRVDVSMTDVIMPWMVYAWSEHQAKDEGEEAGVLNGKFPCYNVYETADGKFLAVGALEHKFWKALLTRLGLEKHIASQFAKGAVREQIFSELRALFLSKTREEWLCFLEGADCCVTPILELDELAGHPYVTARGLIQPDIGWSAAPGALTPPLTLGFDPGAKEPPALGGNTLEVLKRFGFGDDEVAALKKAGALG
jgi:crotonobetainyl-CoA:carnitine CoA-transferase CaiB-like acyl-CoA transferase